MTEMKTMESYLSTFYDFKYEGKAKCSFEGGLSEDVDFSIQLLTNGRIIGELKFITFHYNEIWGYHEELRKFTLEGIVKNSNTALVAKDCYLTTLSVKQTFEEQTIFESGKGKFSCSKVIFRPEDESSLPKNEILVDFGVLNVYETDKIIVNTSIGELEFGQKHDLKDLTNLMRLFRIPLITSYVRLTIQPSGLRLEDIISKSVNVVENFLKITSLSQTVWHEWAFFIVYEKKDNSEEYRQIYRQLRSPKAKIPVLRQLTNPAHSSFFIKTAWQGYSKELEEKYGFDIALELYIESNLAGTIETKFLNATTCLELLMEKLHSMHNLEYLLDEQTFNELYADLREFLTSKLTEKGLDMGICDAVVANSQNIRRRSYSNKARRLVRYWGISNDEIDKGVVTVKDVRNNITHRGRHRDDVQIVFEAYDILFTILTRVFLAMLKYDGIYYNTTDRGRPKWINFRDVCNKIGTSGF
jgi:hypothetical protein